MKNTSPEPQGSEPGDGLVADEGLPGMRLTFFGPGTAGAEPPAEPV